MTHLSKPRGETICGQPGEWTADINWVTCPQCLKIYKGEFEREEMAEEDELNKLKQLDRQAAVRVGALAEARSRQWEDDSIQFPRLIAEIEANGGFTVDLLADLSKSMDLDVGNIYKLVDRAQAKWDQIKENL